MKIIQVVTQMEAGGAQKVASLLTTGLRERGHDAQLWFLYKKRPAYAESPHVRVLFATRPRLAELAQLGFLLWKELLRHQPDVVITHTHSANSFAAPIAAAAQVPVRIAVHHNPVETYSSSMRLADRCAFVAGCYSSMVTVSGGVMQSFSGHSPAYQQRLHRIYNAVEAVDPGEARDDMELHLRYGVPASMKILVNVGRLSGQKNQGLLLRLLQRMPDVFLLLVGEGEMRHQFIHDAVVLGVAERVRFTGEIPPKQVREILRQAQVFLLPSAYESFCLAAVEAMQCGLPVIATDHRCLREVLGDKQLFFSFNDLDELAARTQYLLSHPQFSEMMGSAGQAQAERFNVDRMVGEYESLLAEAALYARPRGSAANDLGRLDSFGSVPGVHNHL
jgi:glycosyltransferase involved in cell wall biosynthesis